MTERPQRSAATRDLAAESQRSVERAAVEPREERLGDVVGGADASAAARAPRAARAVAADGVDHAGERGAGEGARVDLRVEGEQRPRHRDDDRRARRAGSISAGVQRTEYDAVDSLFAPLPRLRWRSSGTIAARGELDRPDRDPSQPADARADVVAASPAPAGRNQPAQHLADRAERTRRRCGRRAGTGGVADQPDGGARGGEHRGDVVGIRERRSRTGGPRDHPPRFPRHLQLDPTGNEPS